MRIRHIRIEFKIQDFWIGAFWRKEGTRFDLWICLLPTAPIHYWHEVKKECPQ